MTFERELAGLAASRGIPLPPDALAVMEVHRRLLVRWNRAVRLVSRTDPREILERHFLESLQAVPFLRPGPGRLVDVGTGNGFPALPLLAAQPELEGILLEPAGRKRAFLKEVLRESGLSERVLVIPDRVDRAADLAALRPFDFLTVRAVGNLESILEGAFGALAPGGRVLLFVGDEGLRVARASRLRVERVVDLPRRRASHLAVLSAERPDPVSG